MGLSDFVRATFWGAIVIFALITFYCWFIVEPRQILTGLGSLGFMVFIAWLGLKLNEK